MKTIQSDNKLSTTESTISTLTDSFKQYNQNFTYIFNKLKEIRKTMDDNTDIVKILKNKRKSPMPPFFSPPKKHKKDKRDPSLQSDSFNSDWLSDTTP